MSVYSRPQNRHRTRSFRVGGLPPPSGSSTTIGGYGTVRGCVRAGLSSPPMMNDPCIPPSLAHPVVVLPALRIHLRLNARPSALSSPACSAFHLDIPSPLASSVPPVIEWPRSGGFRSLSLLPPTRPFYFSFIFPTREPSRCNLHPSCCCCRRPSRLPRATIGVARLAPRKIVVSGKEILLI